MLVAWVIAQLHCCTQAPYPTAGRLCFWVNRFGQLEKGGVRRDFPGLEWLHSDLKQCRPFSPQQLWQPWLEKIICRYQSHGFHGHLNNFSLELLLTPITIGCFRADAPVYFNVKRTKCNREVQLFYHFQKGCLPFGFPSPRIITLSLGGVVAPGCDNEGRK